MLRRLSSSVSSKILLVLVIFLALEYFPYTGIYLMFIGGPVIAGIIVHLFFLSVLIEAVTGRIPRLFVLVPIVAYGGYYAAYSWEGLQVAEMSKTLRRTNPGKVYDFDPTVSSLVMNGAEAFVETHDVPVVYEPNSNYPEGYLSDRLITRAQCNGIKRDTQNRVWTMGVSFDRVIQQNICFLRFPEPPTKKIVQVTLVGDPQIWARHSGIRQQKTEISIDGKTIGSFTRAYLWRLPAFPLAAIGCFLIDSPGMWKCDAFFVRNLMTIDGIPDTVDRARFDEPVSVMLGIRKYVASDLANFAGFDSNLPAIDRVHEEPQKVENNVFDALDAIIEGKNPNPPFNLGYSVATNPERLAPRAEGMARRFSALVRQDVMTIPNGRLQIEALAVAIGALPHDAFASVAGTLFDVIKENPQRALKSFSMIFVRVGEAGAVTLPFYRDQVMHREIKGWERMFPVLAICRIGEADADLIEDIKRRYVAVDLQGGGDPGNYKTSLFVTLLKLGQESFLRGNYPNKNERDQWYEEVLAGKGFTKTGPNNCMPEDWGPGIYATPEIAPSLKFVRGKWEVRDASRNR